MRSRARVRNEDGFGLIELLIAMVMLNVGILALVTAFQSGAFAIKRAGKISTAAAIADVQMERYRGYKYCSISFAAADVAAAQADATWTSETALATQTQITPSTDGDTTCASTTPPAESKPIQTVTGPDKNTYRVDIYIFSDTVTSGRALKRVTVIVRDVGNLAGKGLARVASTFDKATAS